MSTYDAQIEQAKHDMESAEEQIAELAEISGDTWVLIKGYLHNAIILSTLTAGKALESIASSPAEEPVSSTPQFQTRVKS